VSGIVDPPGAVARHVLLDHAGSGPPHAAVATIIDQAIKKPNFSRRFAVALKLFRLGTVCREVCSGADRSEHRENGDNARKISLLSAWHSPCSFLPRGGADATTAR
jgi:hypothetical protein